MFDETDRQVWMLATSVPLLSKQLAFLCAALNVLIPGSGTFIASCYNQNQTVSKT